MRSVAFVVVCGSAAGLVSMAVACGSSGGSGGGAAPCATDGATSFDVRADAPGDAGLACEAGSVAMMGKCVNVAGDLQGLRWELPCTNHADPLCFTEVGDGGVEEVLSSTLGGTPGQTYAVTLHFRGEVEQKTYIGSADAGSPTTAGAQGLANAEFFVAGGRDNGDTWNIYEMQVSDPPSVYFLNAGMSNFSFTFWIDYTATIPMKAGATLTLSGNSVDGREIANIDDLDGGPVIVPGVPPYPNAFDGQFIQMDVVSVVATP